jgi:uncharacterized surface protein with fasciclin (FAS1) repeats
VTTLALDANWSPPAGDIWLNVRYDPAVIRYEGTRFRTGGTSSVTSATRTQLGTVFVQLVDPADGFGIGPLAEITFSGLANGSSALGIELQHVRSYQAGRPVDITDSAAMAPGVFTVLASAPENMTTLPTATPNLTATRTAAPTVPPSLPTLPPTLTPITPATTILYGDDYSGAVSPTWTMTPTATIPASNRTIAKIALANPDFSVFVNATREAGLDGVLERAGPVTAFVPTNAAFDAQPPGAIDALFANRTALEAVVRYHLTPGSLTVADVAAQASVPTLLGVPLRVTVRQGGAVGIGGANLTLLDIPAKNGMVHIVDGVLIPPGVTLAPATSPAATTPTSLQPTTSPITPRATRAGSLGPIGAGALALLIVMRHRRT